jgi:hypothetical protein
MAKIPWSSKARSNKVDEILNIQHSFTNDESFFAIAGHADNPMFLLDEIFVQSVFDIKVSNERNANWTTAVSVDQKIPTPLFSRRPNSKFRSINLAFDELV